MRLITCRPKSLPLDKLAAAARRAIEINPDNALERREVARTPIGRRGGPRRIAVVIARKWPASGVRLSVSFMDNPPRDLRARILLHMNAWGESANVRLRRDRGHRRRCASPGSTTPDDMAGYWSYVGTEILEIERRRADVEPRRLHDAHVRRRSSAASSGTRPATRWASTTSTCAATSSKRIDRAKAIAYFDRTRRLDARRKSKSRC